MTHRHFAFGAVKNELELLFPVFEEERFCFFHFALLGAQAQLVTDAVFSAPELTIVMVFQPESSIGLFGTPVERKCLYG